MAIATTQFRPVLVGEENNNKPIYQRINWKWFLQRIPMFLFAIVSSYGVGHFLYLSDIPAPFYQLGGISFDIGFLGVIALADMQISRTTASTIIYYALNGVMSGLAALFNVLSHAGGKYTNVTAEHITAGIPFALLGLFFALYYHSVMRQYIQQEIDSEERKQEQEALVKEKCKYCGEGKPSVQAVWGHYRSCAMKRQHDLLAAANNLEACTCKLHTS
jgi:hypothetical protein